MSRQIPENPLLGKINSLQPGKEIPCSVAGIRPQAAGFTDISAKPVPFF
jgi:hypothetical protein